MCVWFKDLGELSLTQHDSARFIPHLPFRRYSRRIDHQNSINLLG